MQHSRLLRLLLTLTLLLSLLPGPALATEQFSVYRESISLGRTRTSAMPAVSLFTLGGSNNVALKSTNEVEWIDRLDLSGADYARTFYDALVNASDGVDADSDTTDDDWLIDPAKGVEVAPADPEFGISATYGALFHSEDFTAEQLGLPSNLDDSHYAVLNTAFTEWASGVTPYLYAVWAAFDRDHPEVFWLSDELQILTDIAADPDGIGVTFFIYLLLQGDVFDENTSETTLFDIRDARYIDGIADPAAAIRADITALNSTVSSILGSAGAGSYDQVKCFNEYLTASSDCNTTKTVDTDGDGQADDYPSSSRSPLTALEGHSGADGPVCEGYARAFKVLCDKAAIPCVLVDGQAINSAGSTEGHMWNYVQLETGGPWYAVDVTWNDPAGGTENTDYLLVGSDTVIGSRRFIDSHPVSNTIFDGGTSFTNGPTLCEDAYGRTITALTLADGISASYEVGEAHPGVNAVAVNSATSNVNDSTIPVPTVASVAWTLGGAPVTDFFTDAGDHTVTVTLTAPDGYTFGDQVTVTGGTYTTNALSGDGAVLTLAKTVGVNAQAVTTPAISGTAGVTAIYGQTLAEVSVDAAVSGLTVTGADGAPLTGGTWAWEDPSLSVGDVSGSPRPFDAVYTPADQTAYTAATAAVQVTVSPKALTDVAIAAIADQAYTGSAIEPAVTLTAGSMVSGDLLVRDTDYSVAYTGNTAAGQATVTVTRKEDSNYTWTGPITVNFNITRTLTGLLAVDGVTAPVTDAAPNTAGITVAPADGITLDAVNTKWYDSGTNTEQTGPFAPSAIYQIEIPYTLAAGHTLGSVTVTATGSASAAVDTANNKIVIIYPATTERAALGGTITIVGTTAYGHQLTADSSQLDYGTATAAAPAYQWLRDGADITGATGSSYTLTAEDIGAAIRVRVTSSGNPGSVTSAETAIVEKAAAGIATAAAAAWTADTVTVTNVTAGQEYAIAAQGAGEPATGWQTTGVFSGLSANTSYMIYVRVAETSTHKAGASVATAVTTDRLEQIITVTNPAPSVRPGGTLDLRTLCSSNAPGAALTYTQEGPLPSGAVFSGSTVTAGGTAGSFAVTVSADAVGDYQAAAAVTITVTITAKTDAGVSVSGVPASVAYGDTFTLTAAVSDQGVGDGAWTWTSGDDSVLSVTNDGTGTATVTAVKPGTAAITVTYESDTTRGSAASTQLTVEKRVITITGVQATPRDYAVGFSSVTLTGGTLQGLAPGDTDAEIGFLLGDGSVDPAAGSGKPVTTSITLTGTKASYYTLAQPTDVTATIHSLASTVMPNYTAISGAGQTLAGTGLGLAAGSTPGVIRWDLPETTAVEANRTYTWTFTPTDPSYDTATGELTLWNYVPQPSSPARPGGAGTVGGSGTAETALPVTTGSAYADGGVTTTAVLEATVEGDRAVSTVSDAIGREILEQAAEGGSQEVVIAPDIHADVTAAAVTIPAESIGGLGDRTRAHLTIATAVAEVCIPNGGLSDLAHGGGSVTVAAEKRGGSVTLVITAGGLDVAALPGGVTLTVPHDICTPGTVAVLVRGDGSREVIRTSVADGDTLTVTIPLSGSAQLEIVENGGRFTDVSPDGWAFDAVNFVTARELYQGVGEGRFAPDAAMTRAMALTVLARLAGQDTGGGATWYERGVAWAVAGGISDGSDLQGLLTREQLAVLLWRCAGSPGGNHSLGHFSDTHLISRWAEPALRWAVEFGILRGKGGGLLDPGGFASRVEVAQMIRRFLENCG